MLEKKGGRVGVFDEEETRSVKKKKRKKKDCQDTEKWNKGRGVWVCWVDWNERLSESGWG